VILQRNIFAHDISRESTYRAFRYLNEEEKAIYGKLFMYYFKCPMMEWEKKQRTSKEHAPYAIVSTDFRELTPRSNPSRDPLLTIFHIGTDQEMEEWLQGK